MRRERPAKGIPQNTFIDFQKYLYEIRAALIKHAFHASTGPNVHAPGCFSTNPKLSEKKQTMHDWLMTIDVAHPPRHPDEVDELLLAAWLRARNSSSLRVLQIIHGYGSSGRGGSLREHVRNWLFTRQHHFDAIIYGEEISPIHPDIEEIISELGYHPETEFRKANPGITLVRIK